MEATNEKLSMIKRIVIGLLDKVKQQVIDGECTDEELTDALTKFHPQAHGYVKEDDFVNYDQALKILGLSNNRTKLHNLCKAYGIKNVKFNNASIGFPKKDIERLAEVLKEEQLKRQRNKKNICKN